MRYWLLKIKDEEFYYIYDMDAEEGLFLPWFMSGARRPSKAGFSGMKEYIENTSESPVVSLIESFDTPDELIAFYQLILGSPGEEKLC